MTLEDSIADSNNDNLPPQVTPSLSKKQRLWKWGKENKKSIAKNLSLIVIGIIIGLFIRGYNVNVRHNFAGDNFGIIHLTDYKLPPLEDDISSSYILPFKGNFSFIIQNRWKEKLMTKIDIDTNYHENGFDFVCVYKDRELYQPCDEGFEIDDSGTVIYEFDLKNAKEPRYDLCVKVWEYTNKNNYAESCMEIEIIAQNEPITLPQNESLINST